MIWRLLFVKNMLILQHHFAMLIVIIYLCRNSSQAQLNSAMRIKNVNVTTFI